MTPAFRKDGFKGSVGDYCLVSILQIIYKIFKKLLAQQITSYMDTFLSVWLSEWLWCTIMYFSNAGKLEKSRQSKESIQSFID